LGYEKVYHTSNPFPFMEMISLQGKTNFFESRVSEYQKAGVMSEKSSQALGVDTGGKVAFDLRGGEVVVTRADADHEDPAIGAFLGLLEADIRAGRHVQSLPDDLARAMLANAHHAVNLDEDIEGEVAL